MNDDIQIADFAPTSFMILTHNASVITFPLEAEGF